MRLFFALLTLSCVFASFAVHPARAQEVEISGPLKGLVLGPRLSVYEDARGELSIDDVLRGSVSFTPSNGEAFPNFGMTRSVYWFQTTLKNSGHGFGHALVEVSYPMLDEVDFYSVDAKGKLLRKLETGSLRPFSERAVPHRHFLFPVEVAPQGSERLIVRVRSSVGVQVPLRLWSARSFIEHDQISAILQGVYFGFMLVMLLYNLFLYFSVREQTYLLYVPMVAGQLLFQLGLHGIAHQVLWPGNAELNRALGASAILLATWAANSFAIEFLDLSKHDPRFYAITRVIRMACLVAGALGPFLPFDVGITIACVLAAAAASSVMVSLFRLWNVSRRPVIMLGVAWTPLLIGTIAIVLEKFGSIPRSFWSENLVQIGSAFEVVVLSIALGDRINHERDEKIKAQELALAHERAAQRAQHEALSIQRRANETLEQRVKERTHELAEANARLSEMSTMDALTGLRNRRHFNERFHDEFARAAREGVSLGVLMVDVDHFKQINDSYGHIVGDQCLVAIAEVIRRAVSRATDTVARYGGEEFVLVLPNTDAEGAKVVAEAVRRGVEALSIEAGGELLRLSVSVGVMSRVPARGERRELFLSRADGALYEAKQRGRNRVHVLEAS